MSDLHIAGSDLRFELTILRDSVAPGALDPLLAVTLNYIAPDGTAGSWTGVIDDAEDGTVHYDLAGVDNADAGQWKVWAAASFTAGGRLITGAAAVQVFAAGTLSPA